MLPAGLMTATATGRVLSLRRAVAVRFIASRVRRDAAAIAELSAAALIRVPLATAVPAAFAGNRLTFPLVTSLASVLHVTFCAVVGVLVLAAARPLLARTRRAFQRVTFTRRPRPTLAAAHRPNTSFYRLMKSCMLRCLSVETKDVKLDLV